MRKRGAVILAVALAITSWLVASTASPALAVSFLKGEYFILPAGHPDTSLVLADGKIDGLLPGLVNGLDCTGGTCLPTKSAAPNSLIPYTDVNGATQQVLWWSTSGASGKIAEKTVLNDAAPFVTSNFFPDGQTDDAHGFRAVHWTGKFIAPLSGQANFTLRADDDAFLFVRGPGIANPLVIDDGGIKGISGAPLAGNLVGLSPGAFYDVDLFFADRHVIQAGIEFTSDVELNATPEPATLLLFGTTLAGLGAAARRFRRKKEAAQI
jgi:fibro-slime domain-containing protein